MSAYATDEDIAIRVPADFLALCPKDQVAAAGLDGVFLPDDPWTLRSPTINFTEAGVSPGQVVRLTGKAGFGVQGDLYAVERVGPGGLTLRQKGQAPGAGRPPAVGSGVEFVIRTLIPQIQQATADLNCRFGIDEAVVGRWSTDHRNPRGLLDATVLTVLARQYLDQSRQFAGRSDEPEDWYGTKARMIKAELAELLDRLNLRWSGGAEDNQASPTTRFGTRLSR